MNLLFVGDIVGNTGKWVLSQVLDSLVKEYQVDICIANGENIAGGKGMTKNLFNKLIHMGVHVVTSGNHIWYNKDIFPVLDSEANIVLVGNARFLFSCGFFGAF